MGRWLLATTAGTLLVCSLVGCSGSEGGQVSSSTAPGAAPSGRDPISFARAQVESDLVLELRRSTADSFEPDRDPALEVVLTNRSASRSYPVVLPGDGSESGWREPHAYFTLERRDSAAAPWTVAPRRPIARCGNFDEDWAKDVVTLAAGKQIVLPGFRFIHWWELDDASHVRVVAHYAYGARARDRRSVPPVLRSMPEFALSSNALELAVDPPIVLEVTWKGSLPKPDQPLAQAFDVVAVNRGKTALPFATADTGASLTIELEGEEADGTTRRHGLETSVSVDDAKARIAPQARLSVVGASKVRHDVPDGFHARRARAFLHLWWYVDEAAGTSDERVARSRWVALSGAAVAPETPF